MALSCLIYALYIWKYDTFFNIKMTFTFVCLLFEKKNRFISSFAKSKIEQLHQLYFLILAIELVL